MKHALKRPSSIFKESGVLSYFGNRELILIPGNPF
jgi:hypothetical protein